VSLQSIVGDGLAARLHSVRAARTAVAEPHPSHLAVRLTGASMRVLETGLALTAIAVAILIGLGR
jgi:hypothetical protein